MFKLLAKSFAVALATALTTSIFLPFVAYADVNDFTVTNFTADYYLSNDDPQGQMRVVEKITVDFTDRNHGILRALPKTYKNLPLNIHINKITSDSGAYVGYTTYDQNGNEVLKIGDPNNTVTGAQEYTIDYTMQNVISFYDGHDELFWNVNGTEWMQDFDHVTAHVHLPSGLTFLRQSVCYQGPQGSTNQDCQVAQTGSSLTVTAGPVYQRDTLSFVAAFPKGYFRAPSRLDYVIGYAPEIFGFTVPFVALGGAGFVWWLKRGRDARGTGIIVPQYDAPDKLTPMEVGALVNFRVDNRDLTATIVDLAIRKYIRIVETHDAESNGYTFELLNKDWSGLRPWEHELMEGIFGYWAQRSTVTLASLKNGLAQSAKNAGKAVSASLAQTGYFAKNPYSYAAFGVGTALLIPLAALLVFMHSTGRLAFVFWGLVVGATVFGIFYHFMSARTAKGVAAREYIEGLKLYLTVAEKDRIKMLQSPDGRYTAWANVPQQTVELFEKLLPYAIVLRVEDQWAKKFDNLYASPPDWYAGNYHMFTTAYLVGSLGNSFNQAMVASFGPVHSSSGSGFGGGFAGGGGGGGGGGGW